MEKLQQVQKYQFWILLVVALILPVVGWFMSRSGLQAEASERAKTLQNKQNSLKASTEDPNSEWQRGLSTVNAEQEKQHLIAWRTLFERQKDFMVWPSNMVNDPAKIEPFHQEIYRENYAGELEKVRQIVKPADEQWQSGLVKFPEELLPALQEEWKLQAPSPRQIEAAQEDLWLLTAILSCIASVNEGSLTPYEAPVREIIDLTLRGGTKGGSSGAAASSPKATGIGAAAMPAGMKDMPAGMKDMPAMPIAGNRAGAGNMGMNDSGTRGITDHKIKVDEVLGPERPATETKPADSKAAAGPPGGAGMPGGAKGMPAMPAGMPLGGGVGDGPRRGGSSNMDRYRDDQKEFKTRGFSLEVVMDLRRVPDLLVALSNCEGWPINILRVHEADYKDGDLVVVDGGGGGGEGAQRGGLPAAFGGAPGGRPLPGIAKGPIQRPDEDDNDAPVNTRSALEDPNLARVAIVGLIYIFKVPPEAPPAATAPETPGAPAAGTAPPAADSPPSADDEPMSEPEASESPEPAAKSDEPDDAAPDSSTDPAESKTEPLAAPTGGAKSDDSKSGAAK